MVAVKCGKSVVTWFAASTNQRRSALSIPHFTFRITHSAIPHFTHSLIILLSLTCIYILCRIVSMKAYYVVFNSVLRWSAVSCGFQAYRVNAVPYRTSRPIARDSHTVTAKTFRRSNSYVFHIVNRLMLFQCSGKVANFRIYNHDFEFLTPKITSNKTQQ